MNIFDVVELKNNKKATIIAIGKNQYKAEVLDAKGKKIGVEEIKAEDIAKIIYKH